MIKSKRKIKIYSWKFILVFVVTLTAFILTFPRDYVQRELKPVFIYKTYQQVIKDKKCTRKSPRRPPSQKGAFLSFRIRILGG